MTATNHGRKRRILGLFALSVLIFSGLSARLVWVQFVKGEKFGELALESRLRGIKVESKRGTIFDRNGEILALSVSADSVYAIPSEIKEPEETARLLVPVLDMSYDELLKKLTKQQFHVYLQQNISAAAAQQIRELRLAGIGLEEKSRRHYPFGKLASHLLGFAGVDNQGLYGLEVTYEKYLRGKPGRIVVEYDARGQEIPGALHKYIPPVDGDNLILTIDRTIQHIAEREMEKAVSSNLAKRGMIIVMDVTTGGILAMATKPDFDPNAPFEYEQELWRNAAVSDSYEPGSTFKVITLTAALEEGVTSLNDRFFCPGSIRIPGSSIRCTRGHGSQSLAEIVQNSCNVGFVTLGLRLGPERLYKYLRLLSFGQKTGIDFPGEATGIVIPESRVKNVDLARIAFGQAISITPLQLVSAVSTIANDGLCSKPHLAQELVDAEGNVLIEFAATPPQRVISEQTARTVQQLMENVVSKGTGRNAKIAGYQVAGKTGTAQKVIESRYAPGKYFASFLGFAPADSPRLAALVVIDEPGRFSYYGGSVAAPVFREVVGAALQYLGVPRRDEVETRAGGTAFVPDVRFLTAAAATARLRETGLGARLEGAGETVVRQVPESGALLAADTKVLLYLGNQGSDDEAMLIIPNLAGLAGEECAQRLKDFGLKIAPVGTGKAVTQEPAAGTSAPVGTTVTVWCE
ncbi:MAG: penicillin-binding transpeptidase domain-containing protein [bacterium]